MRKFLFLLFLGITLCFLWIHSESSNESCENLMTDIGLKNNMSLPGKSSPSNFPEKIGSHLPASKKQSVEPTQETEDQQVKEIKKEVRERAKNILAKNPCDATLDDWYQAGQCAADAFQIGDEALAEQLMEWIRITFRALVAEDVDAIIEATLMEKLLRGEGQDLLEHGRVQEEVQRSEGTLRMRAELAAQAQYLGFKHLANDILAGNYIQSSCVQVWDIVVSLEFQSTEESWLLDTWKSHVVFKDVPIYFWDPELGLAPLYRTFLSKGTLTGARFGWYDGAEWIKGTAQGKPVYEFQIFQWIEDQDNYQDSPFIANLHYAPYYIIKDESASDYRFDRTSFSNNLSSHIYSQVTKSRNPGESQAYQDSSSSRYSLLQSGPRAQTAGTHENDANVLPIFISGKVTLSSGLDSDASRVGLTGVVMSGLPGNPFTDEEGKYSAQVEPGWTGYVIPIKAPYIFSPSYKEYSDVTEDLPDQDYTALVMAPTTTQRPEISKNFEPNVVVTYPDGEKGTFGGAHVSLKSQGDANAIIPIEKLKKRKPFTIEATDEDVNYICKATFEFLPKRKLKWKESQSR